MTQSRFFEVLKAPLTVILSERSESKDLLTKAKSKDLLIYYSATSAIIGSSADRNMTLGLLLSL